jgi:transposase
MSKELLSMIKPLKKIVNDDFYVLTNDERPTEPRTTAITAKA